MFYVYQTMLLIYILLMAYAGAHQIHFLGAGENHAPGHFHYKVSVPYAWDSSSSIEYFECESYDCNSPVSIRKIQITDWANTAGLQIQKSDNVYDIECDSDCLQHTVYKYVKAEFRTSTDVSGEVVETCPGQFVLADGSCTDTCVFENIKGVCSRVKILCLHGHETPTLSSSCRTYDRNAPICSEGVNTGVTCRCFSSCGVEVEMVATNEVCLNGKRSEDFSVIFKQKMMAIQNTVTNMYEFFYPNAPENTWYDANASTVERSISYLSSYISDRGSFDAILGFAQGAAMALAYIADGTVFNKTVLLEGYVPDVLNQRISSGAPFENLDTLLYFAKQSPLYSPSLKDEFTSPTVIEADVTYGVPQNTSVTAQIKYFLESVAPVPVLQNSTVMQNSTCIQYSGTECILVACDTGYYISDDNITCIQCEPGYQCPCDICDTREECPPGQYQPLAGQTSCDTCSGIVSEDRTQCGLGICTNITNGGCKEITCPAGFYEVSYNVTTSSPAPALSSTLVLGSAPAPVVGNSTCIQYSGSTCELAICDDEGYYRSDDNVTCVQCPPGTKCPCSIFDVMETCSGQNEYQDEAGQTECKTCNGVVSTDKTECVAPAPVLSAETYVKCMPCAPGTFQSITGQTSCDACSPGTYQNATGQSSCKTCSGIVNAARTECSGGAAPSIANGTCITHLGTTCTMVICDRGYYRSADNSTCVQCEPGYQCACDICDTREECPTNTYQDIAGQTTCKSCSDTVSANRTTCSVIPLCETHTCGAGMRHKQLAGVCSESGCTDNICCEQDVAPTISNGICEQYDANTCLFANCDAGHYRSGDNSSCLACFHGTYQDQQGQATCVNAAVGHHVAGTAQTAQTACSPGTSQASTGQQSCDDCVAGRYQAQNGQADCVNAAVGHYVAGTAQTTQTVCLPGTSQASTGQQSCVDCVAGKYQSQTAQTSCKDCPSGTFSTQNGASTCQDCQAGQHVNANNTACVDCVAGKYQDANKQTSCKQCQKGYCPTGATQQLSCPAGNMIDAGRTSCTQCIEGKFQSLPNQGACTFCEVRKSRILDGTGQPLILGYYQDEKGQTRCKRCDGAVSANSAGLSFAKCAATCTFAAKPHICPFKMELKPQGLLPLACEASSCNNTECCRENQARKDKVTARAGNIETTLLAVFNTVVNADGRDDVGKAAERTTVQNTIRFEKQGDETDADALGRILGDVTDDIGAKSIEKIDEEVYEMTQEELQQERATERRKSPTEQRAKKEQEAVDVSSLKCKELMKNAEDIQNSVEKEKALVEVTKAMSIVKETIAEQQKQLRTATSSLANEDTLGVIVNTKDLPPRNPKLREKMEKGRLPFLKIKIPKDHTSVTDWADFDCSNADVNFDIIGIDDLEEVIIDTGEKAAACKNGKLVTYVETKQKTDGYDIFNVYCCQNTTRRRLGDRGRILSSTGRECVQQTHAARTIDGKFIADDEWISGDEYECADSGTYKHPVMSLGATFDGCFVQELLNETGWVYDSPGRTLGDCGSSQCTVNNTNVTCLYLGNSCQPGCEAGYASNGLPLTCSGGDLYSTSETTCTGCAAGKKATAGATTCSDCLAGQYSNALAEQCTTCPTGWVSASNGSASCTDCDATGKYNANAGQTSCFAVPESGTSYITRIDRTAVECEYGGQPVYLASGQYYSGCNSPEIVMFGRAKIKVGGVCANKCVKWYSTASGSGLVDGFTNPGKAGSTVMEVTDMAAYCTYLWGTTFNVPKSDEC